MAQHWPKELQDAMDAAWIGSRASRAIRAEITRLVGEAKQLPVLVIDEAQHLRNDVLEDLRLLNLCRTIDYAARGFDAGACGYSLRGQKEVNAPPGSA